LWGVVQYDYTRGLDLLRSRNINAPLPGSNAPIKPPAFQYESTGASAEHELLLAVRGSIGKSSVYANYTFGRRYGDTDGASTLPANSYDLPAEWGPLASNGRHDFVTRSVVWFLGDLEPGQDKEVTVELMAINPGEFKHIATVSAARGLRAQGEMVTRIEGLPALLMELVDTEDPVEVGKETSYEIRVTNTGTKAETNLQLTCTIPDSMEIRAAKGAAGCPFRVEGRELIFAPLPRLAPRVDAIYRVTVRCMGAGDMRFQARMRADGLTQPVLREESTRVYGDEK